MKRFLIYSSSLLISALSVWAGEFTLEGTTDKEVALYQPGEKMTFFIKLVDGSTPISGKKLKWKRSGDDGKVETGNAVSSSTEPLRISTSLEQPGFVRIEVWAFDESDKPLLNSKKQNLRFDGGAGVEVEKLESIPEPTDFDAFWAKQKARLAEVPLKFSFAEVDSTNLGFDVYDVKVDCAGGRPVSGYLSKPKNATPKSLKAYIAFMGYGVCSASPGYLPNTLVFKINAHGIENGKDADYYQNLQNGELKSYGYKNDENAKPETTYFNGMILRVMRALEFLKAQPEWDGKNLSVNGGSQGGFQAIAAAALDKDVSECNVTIPWFCDLAGITLGRLRGWRPDYAVGLSYYDPVNMAKRIHCITTIDAGLGDYICPPSGVCVLYNHINAPKKLHLSQGKTHEYTPSNPQKIQLILAVPSEGEK